VFPVKYALGFYIPEDGVLHSHAVKTSTLIKPTTRSENQLDNRIRNKMSLYV
jgi:hypothetical protein